MTAPDLLFEVTCAKRAAVTNARHVLGRDDALFERLPDRPKYFAPMTGSHRACSDEAVRLNQVQLRSGFLHYLFAPDVVTPEKGEVSS